MYKQVFRRDEKKYLLTPAQKSKLLKRIAQYIQPDEYFSSTICSLYFDTPTQDLIIQAISKPAYKLKIRLRSYGIPTLNDEVFLEVKNKFRGIVSKRRFKIKLSNFYQYYDTLKTHNDFTSAPDNPPPHGAAPKNTSPASASSSTSPLTNSDSPQIAREIDYLFHYYHLRPNWLVCYDRESYCGISDPHLPITFDSNLRSRRDHLRLEKGDQGSTYFSRPHYIMEIKALDAMPLWLTHALTELKIYPVSFTKYGNIYKSAKPDTTTASHKSAQSDTSRE